MSFQSLGFLAFLAVTLAVCLPVGRRSPRGGAALLAIESRGANLEDYFLSMIGGVRHA